MMMMIMMMTIVHQQMFPEREWVGRRIVMVLAVVVVAVAVAVAVVRLGKRLFGGEKSRSWLLFICFILGDFLG